MILCPTSNFESDKTLSIELSNDDEFELVSDNETTLEPIRIRLLWFLY